MRLLFALSSSQWTLEKRKEKKRKSLSVHMFDTDKTQTQMLVQCAPRDVWPGAK